MQDTEFNSIVLILCRTELETTEKRRNELKEQSTSTKKYLEEVRCGLPPNA